MRYEDFEFLLCEPQDDGVMLVTLNRPDAMNATNDRMHWELTRIWGVVNDDPGVKGGRGHRRRRAGVLGRRRPVRRGGHVQHSHETTMRVMKEASDIVYNMLACDKPIISAINGTAVGAGRHKWPCWPM